MLTVQSSLFFQNVKVSYIGSKTDFSVIFFPQKSPTVKVGLFLYLFAECVTLSRIKKQWKKQGIGFCIWDEIQHFCIAAYKAIEYRTTLVRSANAGYSVVLDPAGNILADLPLFEQTALSYKVPVFKRTMTTYARFGNWLPYTCIVIFILVSIQMAYTFTFDDFIPSERNKPVKLKKSSKKVIQTFSNDKIQRF